MFGDYSNSRISSNAIPTPPSLQFNGKTISEAFLAALQEFPTATLRAEISNISTSFSASPYRSIKFELEVSIEQQYSILK